MTSKDNYNISDSFFYFSSKLEQPVIQNCWTYLDKIPLNHANKVMYN